MKIVPRTTKQKHKARTENGPPGSAERGQRTQRQSIKVKEKKDTRRFSRSAFQSSKFKDQGSRIKDEKKKGKRILNKIKDKRHKGTHLRYIYLRDA